MAQQEIANLLLQQRQQLFERWLAAVRADARLAIKEEMSAADLLNHLPAMLEQICELLKKGEMPEVRNTHEARASIYTRINQGFTGRDVARELCLFRLVLLEALLTIQTNPTTALAPKDRHQADVIIHLYIDEAMRYAISAYTDMVRFRPDLGG